VIQSKSDLDDLVSPGMPLAITTDLDHLYVVAEVDETKIQDVKQGNAVKISIDAFSDQTFSGKVEQIGLGTEATFSMVPNINTGGNYTEVVQRIPVKISLDSYGGARLVPGLNADVKIEK
jgi:multidrug resistance efflux pump